MLTRPNPNRLAATIIAVLVVTATSPSVQAQQPAPQNLPTPPDSAKPKAAAPPAEAMPTGDPKTGVLKPPDIDPKMAKAVPDVDPAMDNPPPGTTKAPADAPPAEAKPR
jgi:hypothetical protein